MTASASPSPRRYSFRQVDVFTEQALLGNPLAVVHDAEDLSDAAMAAFARWTGLSETTFLLAPTHPEADYRVRIFTQTGELPFAGHPTLGSCHAWLEAGGRPQGATVVQECGAGLVRVRRDGARLAFAAPPLRKSGPLDDATLAHLVRCLNLDLTDILGSQWADNGPGWAAVMLVSRARVLGLQPDFAAMGALKIGVVGPWDPATDGDEAQFEVRAFAPASGVHEDPVTGSLNAGIAQWLIGSGQAPASYVASQGTRLGRAGRVHIDGEGNDIWVGGASTTCIVGAVHL